MSLITRMRKQTAVYWARQRDVAGNAKNDKYGQPLFADPIQIKCRWVGKQTQIQNNLGTTIMSDATVYCDRQVYVGEMLWQGTLIDASQLGLTRGSEGVFEIQKAEDTPNLKAKEHLYTAYL